MKSTHETLSELLSSYSAEVVRFGGTPFGVAMQDPLKYKLRTLGAKYALHLNNDNELKKSRKAFNSFLDEKMKRLRFFTANFRNFLTEFENLGYHNLDDDCQLVLRNSLNVTLRPYQQQSLRWALDQEQREGGLYSHFIAPVIARDGTDTGIYFNPFMTV